MWSDFESDVVEGRFPLEKLVRTEGRCAWYVSKRGEKPMLISLTESLNDEAPLLERLKAAERVHQQNVAEISEIGSTTLRDTPMVYAVMEFTEENLDDVLRARPLSADETRQVAESLIDALAAIHKERLVCGGLEAASVLAAGDTIKLRSDHLKVVPAGENLAPQVTKDVRDLGALIFQCLMGRRLKAGTDANDSSLQLLPAPFTQIVRRALSGQATVEEISSLLRPGRPLPKASVPAVPVPATPAPSLAFAAKADEKKAVPTAPVSVPATASAKAAPVAAKPAAASVPAKPVTAPIPFPEDAPAADRSKLPWIVGGFVVLLILAAFVIWPMLRGSSEKKTDAAPRQVVVQPAPAPAPAAPVAVSAAKPSAMKASKPASVAAPAPVVKAAPPAPGTAVWRVVAYTYNHQDQAEQKAQSITAKHSDLQAEVFSPKGGAPYLVTLGGPMERDAAFQFKSKAIGEGMPRDTYAQNYSH